MWSADHASANPTPSHTRSRRVPIRSAVTAISAAFGDPTGRDI